MKVYVVMAEICKGTILRGVYWKAADAVKRCEEIKNLSYFDENRGDDVWIQKEEVK